MHNKICLPRLKSSPKRTHSHLPPLLTVIFHPFPCGPSPLLLLPDNLTPPGGQPPPLLAVSLHPSSWWLINLTPPHRAVILYPSCWQPISSLSTQRSSSTPPAGGQIHPTQQSSSTHAVGQTHLSVPSVHSTPLLAIKLAPLRPAVILHPCWGSDCHPSPHSGYPPPLLGVKLKRESGDVVRGDKGDPPTS